MSSGQQADLYLLFNAGKGVLRDVNDKPVHDSHGKPYVRPEVQHMVFSRVAASQISKAERRSRVLEDFEKEKRRLLGLLQAPVSNPDHLSVDDWQDMLKREILHCLSCRVFYESDGTVADTDFYTERGCLAQAPLQELAQIASWLKRNPQHAHSQSAMFSRLAKIRVW